MKYYATDLGQILKGIDGEPLKFANAAGTATEEINVKTAFKKALLGVYPDEQPSQMNPSGGISFDKKMERYKIAEKLLGCTAEVDLSTEENKELKECVNKMYYSPEAIGFLEKIIERKTEGAVY